MASQAAVKVPKHETKIHLPEVPGSFTFRKNGKPRLDQQVKKFCLLNKCIGCFECKVHFGRWVNANKINYDAKADGIHVDTLGDQKKYKLFVPYPEHVTLSIPENPEAQFFCGVLSCKLAITKYDKKHFLKEAMRKNTKNSGSKNEHLKHNQIGDDDEKENTGETKAKTEGKPVLKRKKKRKLSMGQLNKKIAENAESMDDGEPPKKKQKKEKGVNPNEMSVDAQHKLIDGVVDKLESIQYEAKRKQIDKDADIKEYMKQRAEKKKRKEAKKAEIRKRFQERREAKQKKKHKENRVMQTPSERKVQFAV
mmetsp:Transcript_33009/g.52881  ORF Transcript_33009/g.52881 Transcript_33009/m.52881 type:complete len:309 (+) Transcript_33009:18-944(+)